MYANKCVHQFKYLIFIVFQRFEGSVHLTVLYGLFFYFSGSSLRKASDRLSSCFIKRNHVYIRNWIQKYKPKKVLSSKKKVGEFVIDKTLLKWFKSGMALMGSNWACKQRHPFNEYPPEERNMLLAERFLPPRLEKHGEHPVPTDGGTWYPQTCRFLGRGEHHIHPYPEKNIMDRPCRTSRTGPDALMTTFRVKEEV